MACHTDVHVHICTHKVVKGGWADAAATDGLAYS